MTYEGLGEGLHSPCYWASCGTSVAGTTTRHGLCLFVLLVNMSSPFRVTITMPSKMRFMLVNSLKRNCSLAAAAGAASSLCLSPLTSPPRGTTFLKWLAFFAAVMTVLLLSDSNGELAHTMGVELDLSDKPAGHDIQSRHYAFLAEHGVVKVLNLKEGVDFTSSSIEEMLKAL
uniref:Uncharacterized protein n=1 Tax=Oryza meridionalis TaxID=40149 RepID=A0A0E0C1K6_9ORYZ